VKPETIIIVTVVVLASVAFLALWVAWVFFCLKTWIGMWAKKNSVELKSYEMRWVDRGPYWFTYVFLILVFRITVGGENTRSGWVWLSPGFFFGGRGSVTWDERVAE